MDNIGGYVNPLRLLQRIPLGVPIQDLRDRLVHIIADFRTQTSLREGCNNILHTDCLLLAQVLSFSCIQFCCHVPSFAIFRCSLLPLGILDYLSEQLTIIVAFVLALCLIVAQGINKDLHVHQLLPALPHAPPSLPQTIFAYMIQI